MASATGIPQLTPDEIARRDPVPTEGLAEDEPLLGRRGAASQREGRALGWNLIIGTALVSQAGIIILLILIFYAIFRFPFSLFSYHPLLNISAVALVTQAVIILQPTHTASQKISGTHVHAALLGVASLAFAAAFVIIEYNKFDHGVNHFTSAHGRLGLATYILILLQALVGVTQFFVPGLYGGVEKAKSVYRWHRASGYALLLLMLITVSAAALTETGGDVLGLRLGHVGGAAALVAVGVAARIRPGKFRFGGGGWASQVVDDSAGEGVVA
ncbi:hypothetical protein V502_06440 [Pseudogymnoascus sp. VKM F-4520 (FW-2644)]|nr:hypothetical protein V502_06440 [Pseudogymnoascus sp. VKM F-4520 (FW-2644)]